MFRMTFGELKAYSRRMLSECIAQGWDGADADAIDALAQFIAVHGHEFRDDAQVPAETLEYYNVH